MTAMTVGNLEFGRRPESAWPAFMEAINFSHPDGPEWQMYPRTAAGDKLAKSNLIEHAAAKKSA